MAGRYFTLPDSQYSRESQYVPLPFDRIMAAAGNQQKQYDKEKQDVIDILGKSWNRLPGDVQSSLQAKQEIDKQLNDFTGKDLLNPAVRSEWHKTKQEILNRFGPMGDVGNFQSNYDAYKEYEKHIVDKADKLGWGEDTLRNELDKAKNQFSTLNPQGGFNQFKGKGIATRVDPNERIGSYVKEAAYQQASRASDYLRGTNDPFTYVATDGNVKTLPREQIIGAAYTKAQGDSELQKSLRQEEQFYGSKSGLDNDALIDEPILDKQGKPTGKTRLRGNTGTILGSAIEGVAREKAFNRDDTGYKFMDNYAAKEALKQKNENPTFDFMYPGIQFAKPSDIKNTEELDVKLSTDAQALDAKQKDLEAKIKTGEYSDPNYIKGKQEEIAIAKENNRRLQVAKDNAFAKESTKLSAEDQKAYQHYQQFQKEINLEPQNMNELIQAMQQDPLATKGASIAANITNNVNKNIKLITESAISPTLVLQGTKKEIELMDEQVNRNFKNAPTYDPSTGNMLTQEDLNEYKEAQYAGYTNEPIGDKGNKLAVKLIPIDEDAPIKQVYMDAPLNFNTYKQKVDPNNTLTTQLVTQQVKDIKDNANLPSGKIVLGDNKNYGEVVVANRLPKNNVHYTTDPNEVVWKDPTGIFHKMTPIEIGAVVTKIKNSK
jgi:hypothetical protein